MPIRKKKPAAASPSPAPAAPPSSAREPSAKQFRCSECGCPHFETVELIPLAKGRTRRTRICRNCGKSVTTIDKPAA